MKSNIHKISLFEKFLNIAFPKRCPCCERVIANSDILCSECSKELKDIVYRKYATGGYPCVSAVAYDGVFAKAILKFKFEGKKQYSHQLATLIADAVKKEYSEEIFDYITYVPLHKVRLRSRGYNQSELLAKSLSEILGIPAIETLRKTRNNEPQHTMNAKKRSENVKGAYRVIDKNLVEGKNILLLDDIITTGNTLGECAKTLDKHLPRSINCVTFAISVIKTT